MIVAIPLKQVDTARRGRIGSHDTAASDAALTEHLS